jgi:hypothetical protein
MFNKQKLLPTFIQVDYIKDGKQKDLHVQTCDFSGNQDMQIGDFSENWYIRPIKMTKKGFEYKTVKEYIRHLKASILKRKIADKITLIYTESYNNYQKIKTPITE